jgi:LacI family transcriptional regulator
MKDVAQRADVSITTVSHVINKTRNVSEETKGAVLRAVKELNYTSSRITRSITDRTVGVAVGDIREDYFPLMIKALETAAETLAVSLIICDSETDPVKEKNNIRLLLDRKINGIILAPTESHTIPEELRNADIPVVLIDRQYDSHNYLFVGINNFQSSYEGTRYLWAKGSKNPGFIGYNGPVSTMKERLQGFKGFITDMQIQTPRVLLLNYNNEDSFPLIRNFILDGNLDGLLCANSSICYETAVVLDSLANKNKQRLKIISYDDIRWLDLLKYPISVISQPVAEIASAALEHVYHMIEHRDSVYDIKRELLFDAAIIDRLK